MNTFPLVYPGSVLKLLDEKDLSPADPIQDEDEDDGAGDVLIQAKNKEKPSFLSRLVVAPISPVVPSTPEAVSEEEQEVLKAFRRASFPNEASSCDY